jgi:dipeptidyl aminopeptidase/acylaminoacyl peptidase
MPLLPRSLRCAASALLLCATFLLPVCAQTSASASPGQSASRQAPTGQRRTETISQIAVSPDGKRIAWLDRGEIRVAPLGNLGQSQRVTAAPSPDGSCTESDLVWSPDSAALAFFSDCADLGGQSDLYLSHLDGNPTQRLSTLNGYVDAPAFSPDGKRIAFLYVEGATRPAGALAAINSPSGVIGEDHIEVQRVAEITVPPDPDCKETPAAESNLPLASRTKCLLSLFRFLTPANLHVYEFDWSPDSKSLAYVAADPPGENNWWVAKLYKQSTADDSNPTTILSPSTVSGPLHGMQIALPRWSPDGKAIAFIGGLMSDQGVTGGDVWVIDAKEDTAGRQPRNLTPNRPASSQWIAWGGDEHIFTLELADGINRLVRLNLQICSPSDKLPQKLPLCVAPIFFAYPGTVGAGAFEHSLSVTADRSLFVFQASTFNQPPEIYAAGPAAALSSQTVGAPGPSHLGTGDASHASAAPSGLTQLSHFNDGLKPTWGDSVSLTWTNDSFHIQGWLLLPANYDPAKKYPLIVEVHGGPAADVASRWNGGGGGFSATGYSALGYFVLMPNPRGSFGQGEAFTQANRKDFGYGDLRDILVGVDTVLAKYPVDPNRVGITGWSYGGFMTMFAVTQTHRFRAAVAGAGISDWLSYYGENSIDQWMIPYFGASVYDDPQVYAKSSAITFIKSVSTPTLAVVGDRDGECPAPQSFEFWHALRDLHVPAQLVVYPNEGHGFSDPAHSRDAQQRAVEWFARYMP